MAAGRQPGHRRLSKYRDRQRARWRSIPSSKWRARSILSTDPPELDRARRSHSAEHSGDARLGMGSVHTVGANSPQNDKFGKHWAFQSWSDGGDLNHAYKVGRVNTPRYVDRKLMCRRRCDYLTQPLGFEGQSRRAVQRAESALFCVGNRREASSGCAGAADRRAGADVAIQLLVERRQRRAGHRRSDDPRSRLAD